MKILARHDSTYMSESELVGVDEATTPHSQLLSNDDDDDDHRKELNIF